MDESARDGRRGREELLAKLSLEDKISLLTGADCWSLHGHPGMGLRPIRTFDGPAGVRGPRRDERGTALNVPAPVALAATWDPRRAELIGSLLAAEAPPGTEVIADIVPHRCLAHWDTAAGTWAIEPGDFHLYIGRSSRDVPLSVTVRC
jgi:hypothetical protein